MIQRNEADLPEMLTELGKGLMATRCFLKELLRHDTSNLSRSSYGPLCISIRRRGVTVLSGGWLDRQI